MTRLQQPANTAITAADFRAPTGIVETQPFRLKRGHWLLMVVGSLCLLSIVFLTVARSIQITTVTPVLTDANQIIPQNARVELNSMVKFPIGNRVLVLPGQHHVAAHADGFQSTQQDITVGSGRHQKFELVLAPLPGQLDVRLIPEVAATVSLDGEFLAELPGLIKGVAAGMHEIRVDAPLYRAATRSIVVQGQGQTEELSVNLDPAWGILSLHSDPDSVSVLIDGLEVGQTPLQIKVEEGSHTLAIQADKYKPYTKDFTMFAQQDLEVPKVKLIPADGILKIKTKPDRAAVILNGEFRGTSPITLKVTPDETQKLQVYKAGFRLRTQQVSLAPDQTDIQQLSLQQDSVSVRFSISPSDAELFIDGVRKGSGSQTLKLNTLPHAVSVRRNGFVDYQNEIIPTRSSAQVVSIELLTKEQHFWANVPESYSTAAGQQMKLFRSPGTVQLGSSRRETGRRSNEVAYRALLQQHFYVSLHEITNKQFRRFLPSHNSGNYKRISLDTGKHPVANVSWQKAALYCNWLSRGEGLSPFYQTKAGYVSANNATANGYRLLTEVEWAWLARNQGETVLTYPWGSSPQISAGQAAGNFADVKAVEFIAFTLADYDDGYKASAPTGRFPANHKGIFDLEGNVSEWVNDWYSSNSKYSSGKQSPPVDPLGPDEGEFHVIRGASWARGHLPQLRLAYRDFGAKGSHDVGFRIARYVGKPN